MGKQMKLFRYCCRSVLWGRAQLEGFINYAANHVRNFKNTLVKLFSDSNRKEKSEKKIFLLGHKDKIENIMDLLELEIARKGSKDQHSKLIHILKDAIASIAIEEKSTKKEQWAKVISMIYTYKKNNAKRCFDRIIVMVDTATIKKKKVEGIKSYIYTIQRIISEIYGFVGYQLPVYLLFDDLAEVKGYVFFSEALQKLGQKTIIGGRIDLIGGSGEADVVHVQNYWDKIYAKLSQLRFELLSSMSGKDEKQGVGLFPEEFSTTWFTEIEAVISSFNRHSRLNSVYFFDANDIIDSLKKYKKGSGTNTVRKSAVLCNNIYTLFTHDVSKIRVPTNSRAGKQILCRCLFVIGIILSILIFSKEMFADLSHNSLIRTEMVNLNKKLNDFLFNTREYSEYSSLSLQKLYRLSQMISLVSGYHSPIGSAINKKIKDKNQGLLVLLFKKGFVNEFLHEVRVKLGKYATLWNNEPQNRYTIRVPYFAYLKAAIMLDDPRTIRVGWLIRFFDAFMVPSFFPGYKETNFNKSMVYFLKKFKSINSMKKSDDKLYSNKIILLAQRQLGMANNPQNLYADLKLHYLYGEHGSASAMVKCIIPYTLLIKSECFNGMYTYVFWKKSVLPLLKAALKEKTGALWGFNRNIRSSAGFELRNSIHQMELMYWRDYYKFWLRSLSSPVIAESSSKDHAGDLLSRVLKKNSHYFARLTNILSNINRALNAISNVKHQRSVLSMSEINPYLIESNYRNIISHVLFLYTNRKNSLSNVKLNSDEVQALLNHKQDKMGLMDATNKIKKIAMVTVIPRLNKALLKYLLLPIREVWSHVLYKNSIYIQQSWLKNVWPYYIKLANTFPLDIYATHSMSLHNFDRLLSPSTGALATFIGNYLPGYIIYANNACTLKQWLHLSLSINRKSLLGLCRLHKLQQNLYLNNILHFELSFKPIPLSSIEGVSIHMLGKSRSYYNGVRQWLNFTWPSNAKNMETSIFINTTQGKRLFLYWRGPWSPFLLLLHSQCIHNKTCGVLRWTFSGNFAYTFNVKKNTAVVRLLLEKSFRLPKNIIAFH